MNPPPQPLYSAAQLAAAWACPLATARQAIRQMDAVKVGNQRRVSQPAIDQWYAATAIAGLRPRLARDYALTSDAQLAELCARALPLFHALQAAHDLKSSKLKSETLPPEPEPRKATAA